MTFRISSVIFDMDGVITHTMPDHYRSWKTVMEAEGIEVTDQDIYQREGQPGLCSVRELFQKYNKTLDDRTATRILENKEQLFKRIAKTRFIQGARQFVKQLHRGNFHLALVTGTSGHELLRILPASMHCLFSVIVTGDQVVHGKPHPEPYLKSLEQLNVDPSQAVVIENAPFGIRSAKQAGLRCLALETSLSREYLTEADAVFTSIKELRQNADFIFDEKAR